MAKTKIGSKSYYHKKLKVAFSRYIIARDKVCQMAGKIDEVFAACGGVLQCSHIKTTKAYPNLRYDPVNAIALCYRHHIHYWHKETGEAYKWWEKAYPAREAYIEANKEKLFHPTAQYLKELLESIKKTTMNFYLNEGGELT